MLAFYPFLVIGLIVGAFLLLNVTDKLGWTSVYKKRDAGTSILGGVLLGSEHLFAPENRRAAIEYRLEKKDQLQQQEAGRDRDPGSQASC
ncbi:hypothetical protein D3C87_739350 [compost metagenome]